MSKDRNLVLVVDDDLGMPRAVKRLLRQHDYEPILFSSAQAFKSHTDIEKAACVILDINLNDGSGIELRHGLNDAGISVPVIYITGNEDPAVRKAALASGCIAFLTKPFSSNAHRAAQESIGSAFIGSHSEACTRLGSSAHHLSATRDAVALFGDAPAHERTSARPCASVVAFERDQCSQTSRSQPQPEATQSPARQGFVSIC